MEHIAIDLGRRESQICVRDETGQILEEARHSTSELRSYLGRRPRGSRVLVESSAEAFTVADWAAELGHEPMVVPSILVPALGIGERGLKNDVRDARKLSEMDCRMAVPSVHIPSAERRAHQARLTARDALVRVRTKLINTVRSFVRMRAIAPIRATPPTLPRAVRATLLQTPEGVPEYLEALLQSLEHLNAQIQQADHALREVAHSEPVCRLLMTMPGVGPVTALSFVSAIDDVTRFEDASRLTSYLGLVPGERTTGFKTRRTAMTKAGPSRVRWTLTQAAWTLVRVQPDSPLGQWYQQVSKRRGKKIAISGLSRRMAAILYAMWREQRPYDATRAASRHG
ncbi:MAG: IS110 family transposase [Myxococcales bacterium]|nr:IS110 family transposase [Deltaproteobacteria bacterium]NNK42134.1 IS110 family transposase [Myxococcales bacterium]NNL24309.1 IS110 family transposase [Myxococcales bacterium]